MSATPLDETAVNSVTDTSLTESATANPYLEYPNVIRAFAILMIVTIHVGGGLNGLYGQLSDADWWLSNYVVIWGRQGTPLFVMVSGLLLLYPAKQQPVSVFYRKRFVKVLIPFIVWSGVYVFWSIYSKGDTYTIKESVNLIFDGPAYYHLWFIQMILGLYIATPILRVYTQGATRADLSYFLMVWFITISLLPLFEFVTGIRIHVQFIITTLYGGFFMLGYALRDVTLRREQIRPVLFGVVAMVLFAQVATLGLTLANDGVVDMRFVTKGSFNNILATTGVFLFLKSLDYRAIYARLPMLRRVISAISRNSFGIYLVHILVLEAISDGYLGFRFNIFDFNKFLSIPLLTIITLTVSWAIAATLKRIPVIRYIVP